jgi:predicted transcriptional regulator of viral defense system
MHPNRLSDASWTRLQNAGDVFRAADARRLGVPSATLTALTRSGELQRLARGVYRITEAPPPTEPDLVTVALRVPHSVICLISALAFHEMTVEVPHTVDIAVRRGTEPPRLDVPPVHSYQVSEPAFSAGVDTHTINSVQVRIYSPAKTVADCFKFRGTVGLDVALDALKRYIERPAASIDELVRYAQIDRVHRVMQPYLTVLVAA